jgi:hypothetical protein
MKFKEGDKVTVLRVPDRAKQFGVMPGMFGNILPIDDPESQKIAADMGLVQVCIHNGFPHGPHFWWKETDLIPCPHVVKLTIVDEGHYIPKLVDNQRGYDPYNSTQRLHGVRYAKT